MERTNQTTVAIVGKHVLFTQCLATALELRNYRCELVWPLPDAAQADQVARRLLAMRPDVALVNADLGPHCNGAELVSPLARAGTAVVVITETVDEPLWGLCLSEGARIVLSQSDRLTSVLSVVRRVSQGRAGLDRPERDRLISVHRRQVAERRELQKRLRRLTNQEGETLRHLMAGLAVREIAAARVVSETTVRTQVKAVLAKLDVRSQLAAVAVAHQAGWTARLPQLAG